MEQAVKEACSSGTSDPVLSLIVEVTAMSIRSNRPLFQNILEEPLIYSRHIYNWVKEALEENEAISKIHRQALRRK